LSVSEVCRQALERFLHEKGAHYLDILDRRPNEEI
jgi:hypothetical protein